MVDDFLHEAGDGYCQSNFFFVSVFLTQAFTPYLGYSLLKLGAIDVNFSNSFRWEHALFVGRGWEETSIEIVAFVDLF